MKLLFLTPQPPYPPNKGTAMRNYGLISGLGARHEIDLLTFAEANDLRSARSSPLAGLCRRIDALPAPRRSTAQRALTTLVSPWPDLALRLWSAPFADRLAAWLRECDYDVVQTEGIEMARYGLLAHRLAPGARWMFDDHNAEWLLQRRTYEAERQLRGWSAGAVYSLIQTWKLKGFERRVCRAADRIMAVSQIDAAAIRQLDPTLRVGVAANGIDTTAYRPGAVTSMEYGFPALVFSGTMDFRPNVDAALWFATNVLPKIRSTLPETEFVIVGQRPHARLEPLRNRPGIRITGAVDDVRPFIAGAAVCVTPLLMGGGTRLKVLEALALGVPVVSTSMGVDGFEVEHGREVLIADDPVRFAAEVLRAIGDAGLRRTLTERGRQFVEERYDWSVIVPKMEEAYSKW
jgi:sugar transferase (PEP-CTERM/EpsH1 system associated)